MAQEITISISLSAYKPSVMSSPVGRAVNGLPFTMTGNLLAEGVILIGTAPTLIPVGQITSPHFAFFKNVDAANYITLRNGSGGADLPQLYPGEAALIPLLTTAMIYGVANLASALLEYLILSL